MRWYIAASSIVITGIVLGDSNALDKVVELGLPVLETSVPVYYSDGAREHAVSLASLLGESVAFFEEEVGVREEFTLALLDSGSWEKVTPIPYGLPFVSGPPYLVCFPADNDHELYRLITSGIVGAGFEETYGMANPELANLFISFIGFHELGHVYARKLGLHYPNNWIFEFMATYFAYFYLDSYHPRYSEMWTDMSAHLASKIDPACRTLEDFERLYVRVGVENYAWYQMVILLRVSEVFRSRGGQFLLTLRDHQWQAESTDFHVGELELLVPGFLAWAERFLVLSFPLGFL